MPGGGALVALGLLALAARWPGLERSLWYDELFTLRWFAGSAGDALGRQVAANNHPPASLLAWLASPWAASEVGLRAPFAALGALAVAALAWTTARLLGSRAGLCAGAVAALAPGHALLGQQVRGYAPLLLACALAPGLLAGCARADPSGARRAQAAAAGAVALAVWSHATGLLAVAAWALVLGLAWARAARRAAPEPPRPGVTGPGEGPPPGGGLAASGTRAGGAGEAAGGDAGRGGAAPAGAPAGAPRAARPSPWGRDEAARALAALALGAGLGLLLLAPVLGRTLKWVRRALAGTLEGALDPGRLGLADPLALLGPAPLALALAGLAALGAARARAWGRGLEATLLLAPVGGALALVAAGAPAYPRFAAFALPGVLALAGAGLAGLLPARRHGRRRAVGAALLAGACAAQAGALARQAGRELMDLRGACRAARAAVGAEGVVRGLGPGGELLDLYDAEAAAARGDDLGPVGVRRAFVAPLPAGVAPAVRARLGPPLLLDGLFGAAAVWVVSPGEDVRGAPGGVEGGPPPGDGPG